MTRHERRRAHGGYRRSILSLRGGLSLMLAILAVLAAVAVTDGETATAKQDPQFPQICADLGISPEDCKGAIVLYGQCDIISSALTTPESELSTYADYIDVDYIYANGIDQPWDEDDVGDLVSGDLVPGYIKLVFLPSGGLNIVCEFDVSSLLLDDRPQETLVTEFICGPDFDPATVGTSRLTSNGRLKVNCHWDQITW